MEQPPFPLVFDPVQRRRARMRAYQQCPEDTRFLHTWAEQQLNDRLTEIRRDFTSPLLLGPDTIIDNEILRAESASHDLISVNLWLHTINDLPGMLIQLKRALKPDGLFMGTMLGGETLHELRHCLQQAEMEIMGGLSPRVAPFADKQQMGALMQRAGYALPVIDSDIITVTYPNLTKLFHDLRGMGDTNMMAARTKHFTPRRLFERTEELYREQFSEPAGKIAASFEIIFLLGWSPHDSQQKPLKPGSAKTRLADVLSSDKKDIPS